MNLAQLLQTNVTPMSRWKPLAEPKEAKKRAPLKPTSVVKMKYKERRENVLKVATDPMTITKIAEVLRMSKYTVRDCCRDLVSEGVMRKSGSPPHRYWRK